MGEINDKPKSKKQRYSIPPACCARSASRQGKRATRKENTMLWTIAVILIILWALGLVSGYTLGNFIHVLLVIAIIVIVIQVIQGRGSE
jgi:fatty acid desaturase